MSFSWEPFGRTRRLAESQERADAAPRKARPAARRATPPGPQLVPVPAPSPAALRREPAQRLVVITCMDARIDPLAILGLGLGDANVLRNGGATVSDDVLRSLRVSHQLLGTRRAVLIGHTDCAGHPSDEAAEAGVRDGLRRIRGSSAVPDSFVIEGLMYDVRTGSLLPLT